MRAMMGMALFVVGASASGCGNCDYTVDGRKVCNTGNTEDKVPFPIGTVADAFNGTSTAQVARVSEIKAAVGASWPVTFCGAYLDRYTDGVDALAGEGSTCVRNYDTTSDAVVRSAFWEADNEAKALFNSFGTTNGYAASFAVTKGGASPERKLWGTGGTGDVPANWCGVYMKEMLCSIAFPQIAIAKPLLDTLVTNGRAAGVPFTAQSNFTTDTNGNEQEVHYIRWVEDGSCDTLFDVCNRREPTTDETKSGFVPSIRNNARGRAILNSLEKKLESDAFCGMWKEGFGLGQAGTALGGGSLTVAFEAATTTTFSLFITIAALFVVTL